MQTRPEASRTDLEQGSRASKGSLPGGEKTGLVHLTTELKQQENSPTRDGRGGGRGMQRTGRKSEGEDRRAKGNVYMKRNIYFTKENQSRKLMKKIEKQNKFRSN